MSERLLIISPVRNEAVHIEKVIRAMAAQTRPVDEWIIVDDGSTDGTREILDQAARDLRFVRVLEAPPAQLPVGADRLSHAAEARVFNFGLESGAPFTHIGKLDGDIELPPDYFSSLLDRFRADPLLGVAGGVVVERDGDIWRVRGASHLEHVRGALRLYSNECFSAIGGIPEILGWDGIDLVLARMRGYRTRSFPGLVARHHRPTGSAQGRLKGHLRWGRCQYIQGYPAYWTAARAFKVAGSQPRIASGITYLYGYGHAAVTGVKRFDEPGYQQHLRGELRGRAVGKISNALKPFGAGRSAPRSSGVSTSRAR